MRLFILGPRIAAAPLGDLDSTEKLDVRAFVELISVTGRRIANEKAEWPAVFNPETLRSNAVDDDPLRAQRLEWYGHVKIITIGMECDIGRGGEHTGLVQNRVEHHAVPFSRRVKA